MTDRSGGWLPNGARCGMVWYAGSSGYRLQRLILLKVWLEYPEPIEHQFPGFFGSRPVDPYSNSMPNNVAGTYAI